MESLGIFVIFGVNFDSFIWKTEIISLEKPTGQRNSAMLSVFNISIHEVCRKFDKNSLKTLKIGNFFVFFCHFSVFFLLKEPRLSLHKRLLDNEVLSG